MGICNLFRAIYYGEYKYRNRSFSQEGEDMIVDNILLDYFPEKYNSGVYVDCGAYDPIQYSNTYRLYLKGWKGLNIDATPGSMRKFKKIRKNDINIECGIGSEHQELTYYIYKEGALNTFNEEDVSKLKEEGRAPEKTVKVEVEPLMEIIKKNLKHYNVDLLDIDCEGLDEIILNSIDFSICKPAIILIEKSNGDESSIGNILHENGYVLCASTTRTGIYRRER